MSIKIHSLGMSKLPGAVDSSSPHPRSEPLVLGWLGRRDFEHARRTEPRFSLWNNYREFVSERDALYVGYDASGVTAQIQRVPFAAFERWVRLTGAPVDIDGLDEFAAHWRWRSLNTEAPSMGRFGVPGDPERNVVGAAGVQIVCLRPELFVRWRDEFARANLFPVPSLDAYAAHIVEFCLFSERRERWPAVRFA